MADLVSESGVEPKDDAPLGPSAMVPADGITLAPEVAAAIAEAFPVCCFALARFALNAPPQALFGCCQWNAAHPPLSAEWQNAAIASVRALCAGWSPPTLAQMQWVPQLLKRGL